MCFSALFCAAFCLVVCSATFTCPTLFNFYPDLHDCTKFYRCMWGQGHAFTCPAGTRWSHKLLTCDHIYNVKCDKGWDQGYGVLAQYRKQSQDSQEAPDFSVDLKGGNLRHELQEVKGNTWSRGHDLYEGKQDENEAASWRYSGEDESSDRDQDRYYDQQDQRNPNYEEQNRYFMRIQKVSSRKNPDYYHPKFSRSDSGDENRRNDDGEDDNDYENDEEEEEKEEEKDDSGEDESAERYFYYNSEPKYKSTYEDYPSPFGEYKLRSSKFGPLRDAYQVSSQSDYKDRRRHDTQGNKDYNQKTTDYGDYDTSMPEEQSSNSVEYTDYPAEYEYTTEEPESTASYDTDADFDYEDHQEPASTVSEPVVEVKQLPEVKSQDEEVKVTKVAPVSAPSRTTQRDEGKSMEERGEKWDYKDYTMYDKLQWLPRYGGHFQQPTMGSPSRTRDYSELRSARYPSYPNQAASGYPSPMEGRYPSQLERVYPNRYPLGQLDSHWTGQQERLENYQERKFPWHLSDMFRAGYGWKKIYHK